MITLPKVLDDNGAELKRLNPIALNISEKSVPLSTAKITLPKDQTIPERGYVELFTVNGSAGIFRARVPSAVYGGRADSYTLEHAVCEVGDWLVRDNIEQVKKTLSQAITQVFGYYGGTRWQLGTVTSGDVVLSANYSNILQTMNSLIQQVKGAMMQFDFSTSPWTINIVKMGTTVSAEGRLSRNIRTATIERDDSELCTRVWLEGLNGGKMDADTISQYGVIERRISGNGYTQSQAETVATAYLERRKRPIYSVKIGGADFSSITGETLDRVAIGKLYRLAIPEDDITVEENIISLDWGDVVNTPNLVDITLNEPTNTLVNYLGKAQQKTFANEQKAEKYYSKVEYDERQLTTLFEKTGVDDLEEGETLYTKVTQTAEAIELLAQNTYGKVSGITITASGIDISGSQYVKIASGGYFQVSTGDFGIDSNSNTYVLWSGSSTASNASFSVQKDGTVILKKLKVANPDGSVVDVNLSSNSGSNNNMWKLWYETIKASTITTDTDGYCTSMTLSNGATINFKHASTATVSSVEMRSRMGTSMVWGCDVMFSDQSSVGSMINAQDAFDTGAAYADGLYSDWGTGKQLGYMDHGTFEPVGSSSTHWYSK